MVLSIVIIIVAVGFVLLRIGLSRVELLRSPSFEGIEDLEIARAYDRISRWPQFRLLRRMFARKLADYRPAGILADIGCGPGYLTTLIARNHRHLQVVGIDTADEMIKVADLNASNLGLSDRVEFRRGDAGSLPIPDGTFGFAVSTFSLHHWSDPSRCLDEIHRTLKAGGQLLLLDLRRDSRRFFFWLLSFAQRVVVPAGIRRINEPLGSLQASYTLTELEDLLAESLFQEHKIEGGTGWVFVWARKGSSEAR
ncbi:MAG: class I SAM-dependent methyltransferase [Candidatus Krumholzibacteria bacterium]|nr:class I SAM-dependent methyltransferase [Candidatus Krumholzibacteria bacterium]